MNNVAEIFSQGEEVVSGQTVDSNAAWLSQQLNALGFSVTRHTAVGDRLEDLTALLTEIAQRADCCLCTGGLGPTCDDLTAEAVAIATGLALQLDEEVLAHMEAYFSRRQRSMPPINRKQAYLPLGALRIDNPVGTAPGFALRFQRCWFVFLPGVPSEMKAMFTAVKAQLLARFSLHPLQLVTLRSLGIGESAIQQSMSGMLWPAWVQLGFRATPDEVQTKLLFSPDAPPTERDACIREVAGRIGDYVFAIDGLQDGLGGDILTVIDRLMQTQKLSLAVLETASHGLLAAKCLGRDWLQEARIAKDMVSAARQLYIDPINAVADLAGELVVRLMHESDCSVALVQLFQGDAIDFQNGDNPIVLYNALKTGDAIVHSRHILAGSAAGKQNQAALLSLDLLRRHLQTACL